MRFAAIMSLATLGLLIAPPSNGVLFEADFYATSRSVVGHR